MPIQFLLERFEQSADQDAIVWRGRVLSYRKLLHTIQEVRALLNEHQIKSGSIVALRADFSPRSIASLLALTERRCTVVPLLRSATEESVEEKCRIAGVELILSIAADDTITINRASEAPLPSLLKQLRDVERAGLVLFTSGSTGQPKGAVHDFSPLLQKFKKRRPQLRILNFLLFDHWGGLNTLFHTLSNTGVVLTVPDRSPETICAAIEQHAIEVLPVSPTFLNLLLLSEAYKRFDLTSLKVISYGTEPMPSSVLKRICDIFPGVRLQQTYGLIELGVMRSKSRGNDSLWVKLGGEGFSWRVVDGKLEIKAKSAMLGYLNAPSPFTDDGWFMTGDLVEVDGEYVHILGRESEQINVGGEKVFPSEVEGVILELDEIADALVYGERNAITGKMVAAKVIPQQAAADADRRRALVRLVKRHCQRKLETFKVPVRIKVVAEIPRSERNKKVRRSEVQ